MTNPLTYTQETYDDIVIGIAEREVEMAVKIAALKRQGDPNVWERENELMMLQNILHALKHYDVDADFLTSEDIYYLHELATQVAQYCPL